MTTRKELIDTVESIGKDARALLDIAQRKAALKRKKANLSKAEIRQIDALIKRSEETISEASELAKARRNGEIEELKSQIKDIEASLAIPLDQDTIDFLKNRKRNLRARLLDKQTKAALDFAGILSAAEIGNIQELLLEAKQAVARRKRAAGFIKSLLQIADLAAGIVRKTSGMF